MSKKHYISFHEFSVFDYASARKAADEARLGWIRILEITCNTITREAMALIPEIILQPGSKIERFRFHPLFAQDLVDCFLRYHDDSSDPAPPRRLTLETTAKSVIYARTFVWLARLTGCDELYLSTSESFQPVAQMNPVLPATTAPFPLKLCLMTGFTTPETIPEFVNSCPLISVFQSTHTPSADDMLAIASLPLLSRLSIDVNGLPVERTRERETFRSLSKARFLRSIRLPVTVPIGDSLHHFIASHPRLRSFLTFDTEVNTELYRIIRDKHDLLARVTIFVMSRWVDTDLVWELAHYI
jgi:hypothetical protein